MRLRIPRRALALAGVTFLTGSLVVVASTVVAPVVAAAAPPPSSVTEFAPKVKWGGRTVAITANPADAQSAIAAAESGGLFKTTDGGTTWRHLDGFAQFRMADVEYAPGNASVVLALSFPDTHTVNQGGIWRSIDGGATWQRPPSQSTPCNASGRGSTYAIAFQRGTNNVFVGTDCGVLRSADLGGTWTAVALPAPVQSLVAQPNGTIDTCGNDGHHRSTDAGLTFTATGTLIGGGGCPFGQQVIAASPLEPNVLFAALGGGNLFESDDGGATWTDLNTSAGRQRPPFVAVNRSRDGDPTHIDVYYGGGLNTFRQTCVSGGTANRCGTGTAWTPVVNGHADQSGGAFSTAPGDNCLMWMVSDGGVEKTSDCGANYSVVGANGNGFHALQLYEVVGQIHPDHTDLYTGTQDNDIWASGDNGLTWPNSICCEGFFFQIPRTSATHDGQTLTGVRCGACRNFRTGPHLSGLADWNNPLAANLSGNPFLVSPGTYVQFAQQTAPNQALYLTTDTGATWTRKPMTGPAALISGGDIRVGLTGRPYLAGPPGEPTMYQPYARPGGTIGLLKITGFLGASATVTDVSTGITSIEGFRGNQPSYCNGQGSFICPTVFAVDPSNPLHLIVVDADAGDMKQSTDGGLTWVVDNALTNAITAGGQFQFGQTVHTIAFDPANSNTILVGTEANGVIASFDRGQTWSKVIGSEQIPAVSSFWFDEVRRNIIVSSYGRGLWKLDLPSADLSVSKTHRPDRLTAGDQVFYDITVRNDGPGAAPTIVTDDLPPGISYVTNTLTPPANCTPSGQRVTCDLGILTAGSSVSFTIKGVVSPSVVADAGGPTSVTNTVSVTSPGAIDPNRDNNRATDTAIVEDRADLAVTKLCKPDTTVDAGKPITCTVFVDNSGPSAARRPVLDDTMLSNGSFTVSDVTSDPAGAACSVGPVTGGQRLVCQLPTVAPASGTQSGRVAVTYTVSASQGQDLNNVATVRSDTPDPDTVNNQTTVSLTIRSVADLAISVAAPATVTAGTDITWTVTARNNGPSTATNVVVADTVPAGVTIQSVSGSGGATCTAGAPGDPLRPATCGFGTLLPPAEGGAPAMMTIRAKVSPRTTGVLLNDARVTSDTFDADNRNNLAHAETSVAVQAALATTIAATPNPVVAGTPLSYQIVVANTGPSTATAVTLTDPLPGALSVTETAVTGGDGGCGLATNTNTVTCQLPDLDPGQRVTVFIYTMVNPSAPASPPGLSNTATATSPVSPPAAATVDTDVATRANLAVVLGSDADVYKPSTVIHYQVTVTNAGPSDARDVTVTVQLPQAKTGFYVSNDAGCPPPSGGVLTCALGTMAAGGTRTFQVNFMIRGNKGTITSTATVTSATTDPDTSNNTSIRNVTVK